MAKRKSKFTCPKIKKFKSSRINKKEELKLMIQQLQIDSNSWFSTLFMSIIIDLIIKYLNDSSLSFLKDADIHISKGI